MSEQGQPAPATGPATAHPGFGTAASGPGAGYPGYPNLGAAAPGPGAGYPGSPGSPSSGAAAPGPGVGYPGSPGPAMAYPGVRPGHPGPAPYPVRQPAMPPAGWRQPAAPRDAWRPPTRVEPVAGTSFAVGYLSVPPTMSGMAIGSLVTGIASLLVLLLVAVVGLSGANAGWGAWVSGAFAVLAALLGTAGVGLGWASLRQVRASGAGAGAAAGRRTGRGLAISGLSCGAAGLGCTVLTYVLILFVQLG